MHVFRKALFFGLVAFCFILNAEVARAIEHSAQNDIPLSLTISGGVSLGAYQAGYIYYTSEMLRSNHLGVDLKLVTGASAGAINSLLSILSVYSAEGPLPPEESLLWKTWTEIGIETLLGDSKKSHPSAFFGISELEKLSAQIAQVWMRGLIPSCDVVLGVTTTLLNPQTIVTRNGIRTTHQEEVFVLRIQGQGLGKPPLVTNYVDHTDAIPHSLLYLSSDPDQQFSALKDLVLSSAAFPGAFPPYPLRYCKTYGLDQQATNECPYASSREELFVDGGVFDNQPLRLALRTAARGLERSNLEFVWRDSPNQKKSEVPESLVLGILDAETKTYPGSVLRSEIDEPIAYYLRDFLSHFVSTARSQQLYSVLEEHPELSQLVSMGQGYFPLASEPLLAFFGFLDRGFREYDFYMGMYDARRNFPSTLASRKRPASQLIYPEEKTASNRWQDFKCLRGLLDQNSELQKECVSPHNQEFKLLAQLSYNRLYSTCRSLSEKDAQAFENRECLLAAKKMNPPQLIPQTNWEKPENQPDSVYALHFLIENNYPFSILPSGSPATEALSEFKKQYRKGLNQLASRQPLDHKLAMNWLGEPAFNFIQYSPSEREVHFLFGELIEGGGSIRLSPFVRAHASLSLHRVQDLFSIQAGAFAVSPMVGAEFEPAWINSAWVQLRLGARAGFQLTPRDGWSTSPCESSGMYGCTRFAIEPYLSVSFLERTRLQLVERILPASRGLPVQHDFIIQFGLELTP